jgi:hypothetical protein
VFEDACFEYKGSWLIEALVVFAVDTTLCRDGLLGSIEIDLAWEALFESLYLFSLSVAFDAAESLLVELLFARLVELPLEVACSVDL